MKKSRTSTLKLILFIALALRLITINQSLWLDEATSAIVARDMSLGEILTEFSPGDFHPPLYYLILKAWAVVLGTSEIALRSLSVLTGVGTVWIVYKIAKLTTNYRSPHFAKASRGKPFTASIASLLLATAGLHIYYSQEARMYALATLFVTSAVYFFIKIAKGGKIWEWIAFSITLVLIGLTDYLPLLILVPFWLFAVLAKRKTNWWKKFIFAHILLVVAGFLWFPVFIQQFSRGIDVEVTAPFWWQILGRTTIKEIFLVPTKFMFGRISLENKLLYGLIVGIVGSLFGYLLLRSAESFKKSRLIWFWLVAPAAIAAISGLRVPVFSYFRLLFILPAFYILVARGITTLTKYRYLAFALILLTNLVTSGAYLSNEKFHREDWRGLVKFVEQEKEGKNAVTLFVADSQMEAYEYYAPTAKISGPTGLEGSFEQIWLMRYVQPIFDAEDTVRAEVEKQGFRKIGEFDFNGVVVWRYEK